MKKLNMKKDNISTEGVLRQLYICRKNHREARKVFREKITEIGTCEYLSENGTYCYNPDCEWYTQNENEWCKSCQELKPLHDDYLKKARMAGSALRRALRTWKEIHETS